MYITEEIKHNIKWKINNYLISDKLILFTSNGKRLKQCYKNGNIGYYINGKFRTLKYIKENCIKLQEINTPF